MEVNNLIGKLVMHKSLGKGEVIDAFIDSENKSPFIVVKFDEGTKNIKFQYPKAFSDFLSIDGDIADEIQKDLRKKIDDENAKKLREEETKRIEESKRTGRRRAEEQKFLDALSKNNIYQGKNFNETKFIEKNRIARERPLLKNYVLTDEQKEALKIMESGANVFLSGEAGTGKSFVINEFIDKNKDKNIIVSAFTGIAAINVGGSTMHRTFGIPVNRTILPNDFNNSPSEALIRADVVIIDEISMCRVDFFEYTVRTIRRAEEIRLERINEGVLNKNLVNDKIQVIVVGDFFQLPPIVTEKDKDIFKEYWNINKCNEYFAFESKLWDEMNFNNIILKNVVRQGEEKEFILNLNKIRKGDASALSWFNENAVRSPIENSITICGRNDSVKRINDENLETINSESRTYKATRSGDICERDIASLPDDSLELKIGMQVMLLRNNDDDGYQNGSLGVITDMLKEFVQVKLNDGKTVMVGEYEWEITDNKFLDGKLQRIVVGTYKQLPVKLAYAITIHKSQGQTYSSTNVIPEIFDNGQLYVALSRVESFKNLTISRKLTRNNLRVSPAVVEFYNKINN